MTRTLPVARAEFVDAIRRDSPGTDLPRFVKVLDALIAWSVARSEQLVLKTADGRGDVISFERVDSKVVFWTAQVFRGAGPKLELYPPSGRSLSVEERALVLDTFNAYSRPPLTDSDRLRISFGALKNDTARAAVLSLLKQLLNASAQPRTAAAWPASTAAAALSEAAAPAQS